MPEISWKPLLAEVIGTFTLIFAGAGAIVVDHATRGGVGLLGIALAHGLAIGVMVSALGAVALSAGFPRDAAVATHLGTPLLAGQMGPGAGVLVEALGTFFLVTVVFGTAVHPQAPRLGGLAIGLTITMDILAFGPLTGAAVNPARAFGPALVSGTWADHWVYWVGPLLGGGAAGWLYAGAYLSDSR